MNAPIIPSPGHRSDRLSTPTSEVAKGNGAGVADGHEQLLVWASRAGRLLEQHAALRSTLDRLRDECRSATDEQLQIERETRRIMAHLQQTLATLHGPDGESGPVKGNAPVGTGPTPLAVRVHQEAPTVRVELLGETALSIDGVPMPGWSRGRARSIFTYLVAHRNRAVPRETLMEMFWPRSDSRAARSNLNFAIHSIRRIFASRQCSGRIVTYQDGAYLIDPALDVRVDAEEFIALAERGLAGRHPDDASNALQAARALYRGDFCASERYERWADEMRSLLRTRYQQVLDAIGRIAEEQCDDRECVSTALQMLAIDPCDERATRRLMQAHLRLGQRHLAMHRYRLLELALAREHGVAPDPESRALYERTRDDQPGGFTRVA